MTWRQRGQGHAGEQLNRMSSTKHEVTSCMGCGSLWMRRPSPDLTRADNGVGGVCLGLHHKLHPWESL